MTRREKHEIAAVTRSFMEDDCDEIRNRYEILFGNAKGMRAYVRKELVAFWTDGNPYLDKEYLDYAWMKVGNRIVNLDDAWCWIRDGLESEIEKKGMLK